MFKIIKMDMDTIKIEVIAKPIAKHFWDRLNKAEKEYSKDYELINKPCKSIDDLVAILDTDLMKEKARIYADFNRLPKWLQIYIGNTYNSDFE
jgi:hypothetical protein